jgi:hypothetical protein
MKTAILATLLTLSASFASAASLEEHAPNTRGIQVVPMPASPDPDYVKTTILYPKDKELRTASPVKGQIKIEGYPLGTDTEMPRKTEIWNDPEGQSLHIFVDNEPYFAVNEALINALDDVEDYFDETADFTIPFKLEAGMHVIRVFPVRSFNESVKSDGAFAASTFYYKTKKETSKVDLSAPYLTYNEPQGEYDYDKKKDQPILLDFYLTNCDLSRDGYKVRLSIDSEDRRTLSAWQPYYIYGLSKGVHKIRLELLDPQNTLVPGPFNDVTRTITIK